MARQVAVILILSDPVIPVAVQAAAGLGGHWLGRGARLRPVLHVLLAPRLSAGMYTSCQWACTQAVSGHAGTKEAATSCVLLAHRLKHHPYSSAGLLDWEGTGWEGTGVGPDSGLSTMSCSHPGRQWACSQAVGGHAGTKGASTSLVWLKYRLPA